MTYFIGAIINYTLNVLNHTPYYIFQRPYHKNFIRWLAKNDWNEGHILWNAILGALTALLITLMIIHTAQMLAVLMACVLITYVYKIIRNYADKFENEVNEE
jgi:ABC-type phosphate transport system permease subunit